MLTDEHKAICVAAVAKWGRRNQILKVAEELRELAEECERAANGCGNAEALALERADVAVTLYQFDELLLPLLAPEVYKALCKQMTILAQRLNE